MRLGIVVIGLLGAFGLDQVRAQAQSAAPASTPPPRSQPASPPPAPSLGEMRNATPIGNPGAWVTTSDYPSEALREQREGVVGFRLTVGPDGRVSGCSVTATSGFAPLDEATCRLLSERATFRPGLDARGRPTASSYSSRVRWIIPRQTVTTLPGSFQVQPVTRAMTYVVEPDGTPTQCSETENGQPFPVELSRSPCKVYDKIKPYLDAQGNPVRKRVTIRYTVTVEDAPE